MASRTNKVEVEITAKDEATPTIDRLERKIDGLESDEARIIVTAQTDRLEKQLADAKQKLEGLDGDEATVQLRAIGNLEQDLEQAQELFRQLDGKTGTVRLNAVNKASGDIDKVGDELRRLDGKAADVRINASSIGAIAGGIGVAGLVGTLFNAGREQANLVLQTKALADETGSTLDQASRLVGVFGQSGVEAQDLSDIITNVNQVLRDNPDLAAKLGVQIGKNTSLIDAFIQSVDGIGAAFDNAGDRSVAAAQLFGEEGKRQVQQVVTAIDGDLVPALEQFKGPIITDETVDNAREMNAQIAEAEASWQRIAILLLPAINFALRELAGFFEADAALGKMVFEGLGLRPFDAGVTATGSRTGVSPEALARINASPTGFSSAANVTIINPPGTPATTVNAARVYDRRNGPS